MSCQITLSPPALLLKEERSQPNYPEIEAGGQSDVQTEDEEAWYICRNCGRKLTQSSNRTTVQGRHTHTFANPSGIVFEIACFKAAQGCRFIGSPSTEFAWFAGYAWQILVCSSCSTHLGWYFSPLVGGASGFFALIVDRISLQSSRQP